MYRRNRPEAKPPPGVTYQEFKQRDTGSWTIKNPSTGDKSMPAGPEDHLRIRQHNVPGFEKEGTKIPRNPKTKRARGSPSTV